MALDAQLMFSDGQTVTATGLSTNVIDLSSSRAIGGGEPMAVVLGVETGAVGTGTYVVGIETSANADMSSPTVISTQTIAAADLAAGKSVVIGVSPGASFQRYMALRYTLGGTAPSVKLSAYLAPASMAPMNPVFYNDSINIA